MNRTTYCRQIERDSGPPALTRDGTTIGNWKVRHEEEIIAIFARCVFGSFGASALDPD